MSNKTQNKKRIVVIGGGTGTFVALTGLKKYPVDLTAIVTMMDSGGSNRTIRDEFGLLPTSDIRQCIVALASEKSNILLRQLFIYRYEHGNGIKGMTFGNLFMAALSDIYGSQEDAIQKTCDLFQINGKILPVTLKNTNLQATYDNGTKIVGEHLIDEPSPDEAVHMITDLTVKPHVSANPKAVQSILDADMVIYGPGDLYTSILSNLIINDITKAVQKTKAKRVFVMNLMTKYGQTTNYTAQDHLDALRHYIGDAVDMVLVNNSSPDKKTLEIYRSEQENIVNSGLKNPYRTKIVLGDLIDKVHHAKSKSDTLKRSLIRHHPDKLAKKLITLL